MKQQEKTVRIIANGEALETSVDVIRAAFGTVAEEMGFTEENAPRYTAFTTLEKLVELRDRKSVFWGLYEDGRQVGFVAVEKEDDGKYWMKRLAVLPEYRHGGSGRVLVDTVIDYVRALGESKLHIGVVYDQTIVVKWYLAQGFKVTKIFGVPELPFKVGFMELELTEKEAE